MGLLQNRENYIEVLSVSSHFRMRGQIEDLVPAPSCVTLGQRLGPSPIFLAFADRLHSQSQSAAGTRLAVVTALKGGSKGIQRQQFKIG